jgi:hypothetical protein
MQQVSTALVIGLDANSLAGSISYTSLGGATPLIGYSCSLLSLGQASGVACGGSNGLNLGLDGYLGGGGVMATSQECCSQ